MQTTDWQPTANHILVAIPERYHAPKGPRSPDGLAITLLAGEDSMQELEAQLRSGGIMQMEVESATSIQNLVRTGMVLALPPRLDDQMVLCMAGDQVRTYADIVQVVEVGDTVYLDWTCLTDENELFPGIYRVPYGAVICIICTSPDFDGIVESFLCPVGGYVLLSRVWAEDVVDEVIEGRSVKCRKRGDFVVQANVAPLANEGVVRWSDSPLGGAAKEVLPGQRVVISAAHALTETICGTDYLCIRHDHILAIKEPAYIDEGASL